MIPFEGEIDFRLHNKGIVPRFFVRADPVYDEKGSPVIDACGKPQEIELELCTISIVGDPFSELTCPAVDSSPMSPHIRFAEQYQSWKAGTDLSVGTSLDAWGQADMTPRFMDDLNRLNIMTVEDLGAVSDAHVTRIVDGRQWRSRAVAWMEARPKKEELSEIQKLKEANEVLMARLDEMDKKEAIRAKMEGVRAGKEAKKSNDA